MPDVATAPTATAAQTAAAGSRMIGFYLGGGGVKVDCLFDTANFLTRDAAGKFYAPVANPVRGIVAEIANSDPVGLNGAMLSFTQKAVSSWSIGLLPGADQFGFCQGRNGASDGTVIMSLENIGSVFHRSDAAATNVARWRTGGEEQWFIGQVPWEGDGRGWGLRNQAMVAWNFYANRDGSSYFGAGNVGFSVTAPAARIHAKAAGEVMRIETPTARGAGGARMDVYDPTGRKGYWGYVGNDDLNFMNEMAAGIGFGTNGTFRWGIDASGHYYAVSDNSYSMGKAGNRISVVYAGTSAISTSDERFKVWIGRAAEDRAAKDRRIARAILDELGWYQFTDAVTEKGPDGARWHYGARAQRIWQIVADEGLAPPLVDVDGTLLPDMSWAGPVAPAWLCFDGWNDQFEDVYRDVVHVEEVQVGAEGTGEFGPDGAEIMRPVTEEVERIEREPTGERELVRAAGHLFGFRVDEMNLLLSWALHDRLSALEAAA